MSRIRTLLVTLLAISGLALTTSATASETALVDMGGVIDADAQASMTPSEVLDRLREGNARYASGALTQQNHLAEASITAAEGQFPMGFVLACVDSRVPVEQVFDVGIGDLFVGRVAGNFVNDDMLGSMEFATAVAGAKVIVVLGHTSCGAVKGACDGVELGHITSLVTAIAPSVEAATPEGETCSSSNPEHVQAVSDHNVQRTVADIRERSEILRQREADGDLQIVGAMYDLASGTVSFYDID